MSLPNEKGDIFMRLPTMTMIMQYIDGDTYKERAIGEYWFVKTKYDNLHKMIIKREAGKLDFTPNCSMAQWGAQAKAMGEYLYQLEIKAEIEGIDLEAIFYIAVPGEKA